MGLGQRKLTSFSGILILRYQKVPLPAETKFLKVEVVIDKPPPMTSLSKELADSLSLLLVQCRTLYLSKIHRCHAWTFILFAPLLESVNVDWLDEF